MYSSVAALIHIRRAKNPNVTCRLVTSLIIFFYDRQNGLERTATI